MRNHMKPRSVHHEAFRPAEAECPLSPCHNCHPLRHASTSSFAQCSAPHHCIFCSSKVRKAQQSVATPHYTQITTRNRNLLNRPQQYSAAKFSRKVFTARSLANHREFTPTRLQGSARTAMTTLAEVSRCACQMLPMRLQMEAEVQFSAASWMILDDLVHRL